VEESSFHKGVIVKRYTAASALTVLIMLALSNVAWAQATNFAMIGVTGDSTLQLSLSALPNPPFSAEPCTAALGFKDNYGLSMPPTWTGTLAIGQSATLPLNGDYIVNQGEERAEVLPMVTPEAGGRLSPTCFASVELLNNISYTSIVVPGSVEYPTRPMFGLVNIGLEVGVVQIARLNVVAVSGEACYAQLGFEDANGNAIGGTENIETSNGLSASFDLYSSTLPPGTAVRPVVKIAAGSALTCLASAEVYAAESETSTTLDTLTYYAPFALASREI
jgi:hypothetical protein